MQNSGELHRAFVVGGHSLNTKKPELANQFFKSMGRIREIALKPPVVRVNLANHPHKNELFTNREKRKNGAAVNPFISKHNFVMFLE